MPAALCCCLMITKVLCFKWLRASAVLLYLLSINCFFSFSPFYYTILTPPPRPMEADCLEERRGRNSLFYFFYLFFSFLSNLLQFFGSFYLSFSCSLIFLASFFVFFFVLITNPLTDLKDKSF